MLIVCELIDPLIVSAHVQHSMIVYTTSPCVSTVAWLL